jgi:hypothetical protein
MGVTVVEERRHGSGRHPCGVVLEPRTVRELDVGHVEANPLARVQVAAAVDDPASVVGRSA